MFDFWNKLYGLNLEEAFVYSGSIMWKTIRYLTRILCIASAQSWIETLSKKQMDNLDCSISNNKLMHAFYNVLCWTR